LSIFINLSSESLFTFDGDSTKAAIPGEVHC
jgi:hypothetical protein